MTSYTFNSKATARQFMVRKALARTRLVGAALALAACGAGGDVAPEPASGELAAEQGEGREDPMNTLSDLKKVLSTVDALSALATLDKQSIERIFGTALEGGLEGRTNRADYYGTPKDPLYREVTLSVLPDRKVVHVVLNDKSAIARRSFGHDRLPIEAPVRLVPNAGPEGFAIYDVELAGPMKQSVAYHFYYYRDVLESFAFGRHSQ